MNLEIVILSEVRERQIPHDIVYMWNLKKKKPTTRVTWTYLHTRNRVTDVETNLWLPGGKAGRYKLEDWGWHIHTNIYKTDN